MLLATEKFIIPIQKSICKVGQRSRFQMSNVENLSPQTIRQVIKEMHEISLNSPEGIKVQINDADVTDIQAFIQGPEGMLFVHCSYFLSNFA